MLDSGSSKDSDSDSQSSSDSSESFCTRTANDGKPDSQSMSDSFCTASDKLEANSRFYKSSENWAASPKKLQDLQQPVTKFSPKNAPTSFKDLLKNDDQLQSNTDGESKSDSSEDDLSTPKVDLNFKGFSPLNPTRVASPCKDTPSPIRTNRDKTSGKASDSTQFLLRFDANRPSDLVKSSQERDNENIEDYLSDDVDIWRILLATDVDKKLLEKIEMPLNLEGHCQVKIDGTALDITATKNAGDNEYFAFEGNDQPLKLAKPITTCLRITKDFTAPEIQLPSTAENCVAIPENLKTRHAPFGSGNPAISSSILPIHMSKKKKTMLPTENISVIQTQFMNSCLYEANASENLEVSFSDSIDSEDDMNNGSCEMLPDCDLYNNSNHKVNSLEKPDQKNFERNSHIVLKSSKVILGESSISKESKGESVQARTEAENASHTKKSCHSTTDMGGVGSEQSKNKKKKKHKKHDKELQEMYPTSGHPISKDLVDHKNFRKKKLKHKKELVEMNTSNKEEMSKLLSIQSEAGSKSDDALKGLTQLVKSKKKKRSQFHTNIQITDLPPSPKKRHKENGEMLAINEVIANNVDVKPDLQSRKATKLEQEENKIQCLNSEQKSSAKKKKKKHKSEVEKNEEIEPAIMSHACKKVKSKTEPTIRKALADAQHDIVSKKKKKKHKREIEKNEEIVPAIVSLTSKKNKSKIEPAMQEHELADAHHDIVSKKKKKKHKREIEKNEETEPSVISFAYKDKLKAEREMPQGDVADAQHDIASKKERKEHRKAGKREYINHKIEETPKSLGKKRKRHSHGQVSGDIPFKKLKDSNFQ